MEEWLDLEDVIERVHDLIDVGLLEDAGQILDSYKPIYPGAWELPYLYSRIADEREEYQEAIGYLRQSLRLGGHNADTYLGLFYAHSELGRMAKGARYLLRARERFPHNEQVVSALIWYYGETNRFHDGLVVFKRAQQTLISSPEIFRNAGLIYQRVGDPESAEQCFRAALERTGLSEEYFDMLGDLLLSTGQNEKAVALYEDFLAKSPNNSHGLSRMVFCLGQLGEQDRAEKTARSAVALYPNSPVGYVDLAYVLTNAGRPDEALVQVERALSVAPLEPEAYRVKAIILSEKDLDTEAHLAFKTALSLSPDNAEILRDFYHHLRKIGDFEQMISTLEQVVRNEHPYCVEDYWFLADHYWEQGHSLRAFQCLAKAHRCMPGENDLLPPLITIMLDRGHMSYAMTSMLGYAMRAGWDDTMSQFVRHSRLRDRYGRESMRFLRFYTERYDRYRRHTYLRYLTIWLQVAPAVICPPTAFIILAAGQPTWAAGCLGAGLALFLGARLAGYLTDGPPLMLLRVEKNAERAS